MDPKEYSQSESDNRANQLNSNNNAYWQSRGYEERPGYWEDDDDVSSSSTADDWDDYDDRSCDYDEQEDADGFYWSDDY